MVKFIKGLAPCYSHSLLEKTHYNLARAHTESFEGVIAEGLRRITGDSNLKTEKLKGRLKCLYFPDNRQEFHLDGEPFLEAFPVQFEIIDRQPLERNLVTKQNYRYLGRAADEINSILRINSTWKD